MKIIVTGGTGFVGSHLINALLRGQPEAQIICVSRTPSAAQTAQGVRHISFDFLAPEAAAQRALAEACIGADVVFHIAAKVAMWGKKEDFYRANVEATRMLLSMAKAGGVRRFVYTSSPSVIANGQDLSGVNESTPYPAHFEAYYPQTKAASEQLVISEHSENFRTIALRPHLIFGPNDTNLVPTILKKARAGRLAIIGAGQNRVDFSFIEDCVQAHLRAERALASDAGYTCGGRPYFVSQGEPMILWDFVNQILSGVGEPPLTKRVSRGVAMAAATVAECVGSLTGKEPALTKFLVSEMATEHFFDISAARHNLGYTPKVTMADGIARTIEWLRR